MVEYNEFAGIIESLISEAGAAFGTRVTTKVYSNITGDVSTSSGASANVNGIFVNRLFGDSLIKEGKFENADAVFITNGSYCLSSNDLVVHAGSVYEVHEAEKKTWMGSPMFSFAKLFAKV